MPFIRAIGSCSLSQTVRAVRRAASMSTSAGMNVAGPVVLRPVELDAAADPRPGQADQRGLDHRLVVDEIVAVGLVLQPVDAAAELREDHHAEEFVLDEQRLPVRGVAASRRCGR